MYSFLSVFYLLFSNNLQALEKGTDQNKKLYKREKAKTGKGVAGILFFLFFWDKKGIH